jgi:DNA-binding transcriptional ArsR family regulator
MRGRGWAYAGAVLGGSVSVAANIAHTFIPPTGAPSGWAPPTGAVALSALWPVMVLVAVEILGRVAWPAGWRWWVLRWGGLTPVTAVAAVVSYRHLSGLLASYGEDAVVAVIGPLAIDGLMVISSAALLSLSGQASCPDTVSRLCVSGHDTDRLSGHAASADEPSEAPVTVVPEPVAGGSGDDPIPADTAPVSALAMSGTVSARMSDTPCAETPVRPARKRPSTAERIARLKERNPDLSVSDIARRLKVTERTVSRHLSAGRLSHAVSDTKTDTSPALADTVSV